MVLLASGVSSSRCFKWAWLKSESDFAFFRWRHLADEPQRRNTWEISPRFFSFTTFIFQYLLFPLNMAFIGLWWRLWEAIYCWWFFWRRPDPVPCKNAKLHWLSRLCWWLVTTRRELRKEEAKNSGRLNFKLFFRSIGNFSHDRYEPKVVDGGGGWKSITQ